MNKNQLNTMHLFLFKREEKSVERRVANKLFNEAMKITLENKNLEEAELAQAMLVVNKVVTEEEIKNDEAYVIQKKIEFLYYLQ